MVVLSEESYWLESLFSCRKPKIRQFLVLPLTIPVYCLRTTPRHVTEFVRGHVYWPSSVNSCACANSVYQALLSPPLEPGNEANVNPAVSTAGREPRSLRKLLATKDTVNGGVIRGGGGGGGG